jgi:hypothetical protein
MALIEPEITIGWIPDDWRSNLHGEDCISCGNPAISDIRELSIHIKTDVYSDSAPLMFVCEVYRDGDS